MDLSADIILGGGVMFLAALLAGAAGFGYGLLSTPLLLVLGFPLPFVVSANLTLALLTRLSVVYRLRQHITARRSVLLITGSIPGLYIGIQVLTGINTHALKLGTGSVVIVATLLLIRAAHAPPPRPIPGAAAAAGFAGGFLGATTSLNGIPAVLLLARDKAAPASFLVDLATYFVVSNAIALGLLATNHALVQRAIVPAALLWLPGALLGNVLGIGLSTRLPTTAFRRLTIAVAFISGVVTVFTA